MANETLPLTPLPAQPMGTDAPAVPATAAPAPDLSALSQPGASIVAGQAAPSLAGTNDYGAAIGAAQQATKNVQELSKPEPPPAPVPHARLLAMINGLATGLGAAATSIATGGKQGGVEEVTRVQGEEAAQKQRAAEFAQAQKNAKIQQQITVADTNYKLAQNIMLLATLPNEIAKSNLEVAGMKQGQEITAADFAASHGGMTAADFNAALSGSAPASGSTGPSQFFVTNAQQQLGAAAKVLGADDQYVKDLQTTISNPQATPKDLWAATQRVQTQLSLQEKATQAQTQKEAAEAGARAKDLNDATGRLAQAEQKYKTSPTPENAKARDAAKVAQKAFEEEDRRQKQIAQDVQNGDPSVIGSAMANGLYAPSQVLSARSMSKPFYSKVIAAADEAAKAQGAPEILDANGKGTGHYFNATKAESQYEYSKNIQTQNVLNKVRTLNEQGGDFDILRDAIVQLPKLDEKTINKVFNATATEFGSEAATNYHMALYNVASLLANVQTGGIPTEGEIQTQLNLMKDSYSQGQLEGALRVARRDLAARGKSMIGDNPYLRAAYPDVLKNASQHQPGDRVTLKNGQEVVIKEIKPDGTFTY